MLRNLFNAYSAQEGAMIDGISKTEWLDLLHEVGLLEEGDNAYDVFEVALRNIGGLKATISSTDAEFVFDMVVSQDAKNVVSLVNVESLEMGSELALRWLDFLTAIKLV